MSVETDENFCESRPADGALDASVDGDRLLSCFTCSTEGRGSSARLGVGYGGDAAFGRVPFEPTDDGFLGALLFRRRPTGTDCAADPSSSDENSLSSAAVGDWFFLDPPDGFGAERGSG